MPKDITNIPIIVIAGPTASGKSELALALAECLGGTVINADSMQIYKDIPVLAATPSPEDKKRVPHRLYEIYDASVRGNVVDWFALCREEIKLARNAERFPIVVGGTGFYLETLTKGVTPIPETPEDIRLEVEHLCQTKGLPELYNILQQTDPQTAARLSPNDTTRIRRAVEIWKHTGHPLSYWHSRPLNAGYRPDEFICIQIKPERSDLYTRIGIRFDSMLAEGAVNEVQKLAARGLSDSLPAMRALGVQELKSYLAGLCSLEEAADTAKMHTRQYAKRQMTWFNNRFKADFTFAGCYGGNNPPSCSFVNELVDNLQKRA